MDERREHMAQATTSKAAGSQAIQAAEAEATHLARLRKNPRHTAVFIMPRDAIKWGDAMAKKYVALRCPKVDRTQDEPTVGLHVGMGTSPGEVLKTVTSIMAKVFGKELGDLLFKLLLKKFSVRWAARIAEVISSPEVLLSMIVALDVFKPILRTVYAREYAEIQAAAQITFRGIAMSGLAFCRPQTRGPRRPRIGQLRPKRGKKQPETRTIQEIMRELEADLDRQEREEE